nr:splicing regulator SDE2-like [Cherax quadricarinatus]
MLAAMNRGMGVDSFKEFTLKDSVYAAATTLNHVTKSTLAHACHNLWPVAMFSDADGQSDEFEGFSMSDEKKMSDLSCAKGIPSEFISNPEEVDIEEVLNIDDSTSVVRSMTDVEKYIEGAQIEKTTNREACRDLSGRRLRDINEEKRLKDFISKKAEREREMQERKRQKFEKLKETPKHIFQNDSYYQQRELREKNLYDSLDKAFENMNDSGPSGIKRQCPDSREKTAFKAKRGRFMDDLDVSSEEDGEEDSEATFGVKNSMCSEKDEDKQSEEKFCKETT